MEELLVNNKKRARDESEELESEIELPEVKRLKENLLDSLEDDDDDAELCEMDGQDLDSFMKSFEDEITVLPSAGESESTVVENLGYLLEASDDELGLPPTSSSSGLDPVELDPVEVDRVESTLSEFGGGFWEIQSYDDDPFGFGFGEEDKNGGEYAELDGLFDYSDMGFGSWRPETLPAQ